LYSQLSSFLPKLSEAAMTRAGVVFAASVTLLAGVVLCAQSRASAADVHVLTQNWVSATSFVAEARDLLNTEVKGEGTQVLMASMTLNRRAKIKLRTALQQLPSENNWAESTERRAVEVYRQVITFLQDELDRSFALDQKIITMKSDEDAANIMAATAELAAQMDDTWKMLPQASLMFSYALVDTKRTTDGTLQHLRLTTSQRRELLTEIRKQFPKASKGLASGQHAVDASMGVLVQLLTGGHRSADAP
jgi:hypothetical protein